MFKTKFKKRKVQEQILSKSENSKIVTLGGPSIDVYYNILKKHNFKEIVSYENNFNVYIEQLILSNKYENVTLKYGNIMDEIDQYSDYLLDLDFCCSILSVKDNLSKIVNNKFILTFALRPISEIDTIKIFKEKTKITNFQTQKYRQENNKGTTMLVINNL